MRYKPLVLASVVLCAAAAMAPNAETAGAQPQYTFTTPNPQATAQFGVSVALGDIDGDGKADVVVGAQSESVGGNFAQGRAYVFSGASGALLCTLTTPTPQAFAYFGNSVALGDVNKDGRAEVAVGAVWQNVGGNVQQGQAYVFAYSVGTCSLLSTLNSPNGQSNGRFGGPLAARDVNGDGNADVCVGAGGETAGGVADQGRVYCFSGATGALLYTLTTPNPEGANFGGSALALGEVDSDNKADIVVGASGETVEGIPQAGRVYVFSGANGTLLYTLKSPNPEAIARFGGPVAVGDTDCDGRADIAAGSSEDVGGVTNQGRVYVFSGATGALRSPPFPPFLTTPNSQANDAFGLAVAAGDVNGDCRADIAVGAYSEDVGGVAGAGRAYVFSGTSGSVLYTYTAPTLETDAVFGYKIATGDFNGDGRADTCVGNPHANVGSNINQGRVYCFLSGGPVGGIAEAPGAADSALGTAESPDGSSATTYAAIAAVAAAAILLAAGVWYARRRWPC